MGEYLRFHKMVTPVIIQVVFWISVAAVVLAGIVNLTQSVITGLAWIVLGPVVVRIYAELLIVLFEINDALQDIRTGTRMHPTQALAGVPSSITPPA